jgi:hypothetical protein
MARIDAAAHNGASSRRAPREAPRQRSHSAARTSGTTTSAERSLMRFTAMKTVRLGKNSGVQGQRPQPGPRRGKVSRPTRPTAAAGAYIAASTTRSKRVRSRPLGYARVLCTSNGAPNRPPRKPSVGNTGMRLPQLARNQLTAKATISGPSRLPGRRSSATIPAPKKLSPTVTSSRWLSGTPRLMLTHSPPSAHTSAARPSATSAQRRGVIAPAPDPGRDRCCPAPPPARRRKGRPWRGTRRPGWWRCGCRSRRRPGWR